MGTAIEHAVPDMVKLPFVIFDIWALWCSAQGWHYALLVVHAKNGMNDPVLSSSSSSSLFGIHHQCVAPLAANSLHSGLFRASSIASSKVSSGWQQSTLAKLDTRTPVQVWTHLCRYKHTFLTGWSSLPRSRRVRTRLRCCCRQRPRLLTTKRVRRFDATVLLKAQHTVILTQSTTTEWTYQLLMGASLRSSAQP